MKNTIKTAMTMLKMLFECKEGKIYFGGKFLLSFINTIISLIPVVVPGLIINELMLGQLSVKLTAYIFILVCVPFILNSIVSIFNTYLFSQYKKIDLFFSMKYYQMAISLDYDTLEKPDIQDLKIRASDAMHNNVVVVDQICAMITAIIGLISTASILSMLHPAIIICQIFVIIAKSFVSKKSEKKCFDITMSVQKLLRIQFGFTQMVDSPDYAKDIRLFQADNMLLSRIKTYQTKIDQQVLKSTVIRTKTSILNDALSVFLQFVSYAIIVFLVLKHQMQIGYVTVFLASSSSFGSSLSAFMNFYVSMSTNSLKVDDYHSFVSLKNDEKIVKNHFLKSDNYEIEFKDVTFAYPGSEKYAIKNLNLKINSGEKLCIVGENGAGKSTFIKLLTGLYKPVKGEILINNININDLFLEEYQKIFACVFQDYTHFLITLSENIIMGKKYDTQKIETVCKESGLIPLIEKLPKRYDTQIGKWIDPDGIEPSGGEAQRIAIARALYHDGDIYILDEPTAALDPNAEYEIYTQFHNMIKDKTAILVTHRLSAVQLADKVAVFDDGQIIEYGTHSELYAKGGKYKEMFDKQSEFYVKAANDIQNEAE